MRPTPRRTGALLRAALLVALAAACGGRDDARAPHESAGGAVSAAPPLRDTVQAPVVDTVQPFAGTWTMPAVASRLEHSQLGPVRELGGVRQPFLSVPGIAFAIPGATLQAYVYADAGAMASDLDAVDTVRVQPKRETVSWTATPSLVISGNLLLVVLTEDRPLRERVRRAIMLGRSEAAH